MNLFENNKVLILVLLFALLFFYFYIYYNFIIKEPFFQLQNDEKIVIHNIQPSVINNFDLNNTKIKVINRNKNIFEINDRGNIVINHPGNYKINFSLSASKRLNLSGLNSSDVYDDDTFFVDSYIEWILGNIIKIPVITENRIDGPENLANFNKILVVEKTPYILEFKYQNIDNRTVNNFVIDNIIFNIEKKK